MVRVPPLESITDPMCSSSAPSTRRHGHVGHHPLGWNVANVGTNGCKESGPTTLRIFASVHQVRTVERSGTVGVLGTYVIFGIAVGLLALTLSDRLHVGAPLRSRALSKGLGDLGTGAPR